MTKKTLKREEERWTDSFLRGPVESKGFLVASRLQPEIGDAAVLGARRGRGQRGREAEGVGRMVARGGRRRRGRRGREAEEAAGSRVMEDGRIEGRGWRGRYVATCTLDRGVQPQRGKVGRHSTRLQRGRGAARRQHHSTCNPFHPHDRFLFSCERLFISFVILVRTFLVFFGRGRNLRDRKFRCFLFYILVEFKLGFLSFFFLKKKLFISYRVIVAIIGIRICRS